ncbi:metal-transporting ATPase [Methylophaga marina]|uniref:Plasma-membrane proton-efflux P-type ATPase n=2 Tax=Methylophaga TaxID=40222 RepID=A0ABN0TDD7_9GAMM|nr:plasma-membrane proton-efflux P-type ATPase [Methylophaga marina]BDZ72557.1 metal-transporting ATPase [Methylophaga marina]
MTSLFQKATDDFAHQPIAKTFNSLNVDASLGLSDAEVHQRQLDYGLNQIINQEESTLQRILKRFWGPIPWMIEIAAILSAAVGKWEDFIIISVLLLINAGLDFFQEHRALNALSALKSQLDTQVRVLRDGKSQLVRSQELVPGDIIRLRMGDLVPADVQLLTGDYLSIDESSLTGESLPVSKRSTDVAYANTIIRQGEMDAIVINTGQQTRFNNVVSLVASASVNEHSHFQKMVLQIGHFLILLSLAMVALIVITGLSRHEDLLELARFALVLLVAAIPVALPAVLSVTMAVGAYKLAKHKAIVTKLTAIEELAGVDIFCSDKTGTLTKNEMQVMEILPFNGTSEAALMRAAVLASRSENTDPIEIPLFRHIKDNYPESDWSTWQQTHFTAFDPSKKYTAAQLQKADQKMAVFKGAPQVIMAMVTNLTDNDINTLNQQINLLASKGYRTLAVAQQYESQEHEFLGLIPLIDPPRDDSKQVIDEMRQRGVEVKMITGDNIAIAREIGHMLGLNKRAVQSKQITGKSGQEIKELASSLAQAIYKRLNPDVSFKQAKQFADEVMTDLENIYDTSLLETEFIHTHESALLDMLESIEIFAEVLPEDKYMIVDALQKSDHIVGMTGDGVNDAPALRKADCGFAVSNATDAARAAADIILTAPGLSVINHAIEQARFTFERMKSYATFRIAETIRIILFMTLSILIFEFYPITALMIILLALLNDLPILTIAYDNTYQSPTPVRWNMHELFILSSALGLAGVCASFLLYLFLREQNLDTDTIQTLIFLKLLIAGHSTIFVTRNNGWFWQKPWPSPLLLAATLGTEIIGTLMAVNGLFITAVSWEYAGLMWLYALVWFVIDNAIKMGIQHFIFNQPRTKKTLSA